MPDLEDIVGILEWNPGSGEGMAIAINEMLDHDLGFSDWSHITEKRCQECGIATERTRTSEDAHA
jgi:hypothetical protein